MSEWQDIETAPKDGTWFVALPQPDLGFGGDPYPPTVCRVTGERYNWAIEATDGFDVECKAMNCGCSRELEDFTHWMPIPAPPEFGK